MTPDVFHAVADVLPEALLAVRAGGAMEIANPAGARLAQSAGGLVGDSMLDLAGVDASTFARFLRRGARTRDMHMGTVSLQATAGEAPRYRVESYLLEPREGDVEALLLLRLMPIASVNLPFHNLTARLDALEHERNEVYDARRDTGALRRLAETDALTGLQNRRGFDNALRALWDIARRQRQPLALASVDLDHFKTVNDNQGHPVGDEYLRRIGQALRAVCRRPDDIAGRVGGEEFMLAFPNTTIDAAERICEQLRAYVQALDLPNPQSSVVPVLTVSIGVSATQAGQQDRLEDFVAAVDGALYRAKHAGRNRVELAAQAQ